MEVSAKLKALRTGRKITQEDLAARVGIKRSTLANWEIGRRQPCLAELRKLADFYGVTLDYFGISEEKNRAFELLLRAKDLFIDPEISDADKDQLFIALSKLYFEIKGE